MPAMPAPQTPTMRARYRAQVRGEVKQAGLSLSAIGKQLGVSGPALYRYFASRDDLLAELVIDAYNDLADALSAAAARQAGRDPRARLEALARGYRPGRSPSRTGTGCCSGPRCPATTRTRKDSSTPRKPR